MKDEENAAKTAVDAGKYDDSHIPSEQRGAGSNSFFKNHTILLGFVITVFSIFGSALYQVREINSSAEKAEKLAYLQHNATISHMFMANNEKNKNDIILARINASLDLASLINISNLAAHFNTNNKEEFCKKILPILGEIQKKCLLLMSIGIEDHVDIATSIIHDIGDIENIINTFNSNVNSITTVTSPHKKEGYIKSFVSDIYDKIYKISVKSVLLHVASRKDFAQLSEDAVKTKLISEDTYRNYMRGITEDNEKRQKTFNESAEKNKKRFITETLRAFGISTNSQPDP